MEKQFYEMLTQIIKGFYPNEDNVLSQKSLFLRFVLYLSFAWSKMMKNAQIIKKVLFHHANEWEPLRNKCNGWDVLHERDH